MLIIIIITTTATTTTTTEQKGGLASLGTKYAIVLSFSGAKVV